MDNSDKDNLPPKISRLKSASPLPVDMRRSKTLLLNSRTVSLLDLKPAPQTKLNFD